MFYNIFLCSEITKDTLFANFGHAYGTPKSQKVEKLGSKVVN